MNCPKCGATAAEGARFCQNCGAPLGAVAEGAASTAAQEAPATAGASASQAGTQGAPGAPPPAAYAAPRVMEGRTQTGLQRNVAALLSYLLGWITGIVLFIIEQDPFVRFHAMQSIVTFGSLSLLSVVVSILFGSARLWALQSLLNSAITLLSLVLWVVLMMKAYRGERYGLPIAGDLAERYAGQLAERAKT